MPIAALAPILAGVVGTLFGAGAATALSAPLIFGVTGAELATGTLLGAGGGALLGGITGGGKGALEGALGGALTGGALSFVPAAGAALGGALGIGTTAGDIAAGSLIGAGTGALGGVITGAGPLSGALTGGLTGAAAGAMAPGASTTAAATAPAGVGPAANPAAVSIPTSGGVGSVGTTDSAAAMGDLFGGTQGGSISGAQGGTATPLGTVSGTQVGTTTNVGGNITPAPLAGGDITQTSLGPQGPGQATIFSSMATTPPPSGGEGAYATPAPSMWDKALGDIGNYFTNPKTLLQAGIGGAGLLMNMVQSNQEQQVLNQEQQAAAGATSMARALDAPLFSGVLPPGAQDALNTSKANQDAQVRSTFATLGMSGSTAEADALDAVDQNIAAQQFSIENQLFGQASGYSQMASQDYANILQQQRLMDQDLGSAITRFVSALAGGGTGGTPTPA